MSLSRVIARPMLASMFVVGAANALRNTEQTASRAQPVAERLMPLVKKVAPGAPIPERPETLVRINAATQLLGALGLATGRAPRTSAALLAASLVPTTLAGHRYWEESDPAQRANQRVHFFKNVSLLGGLIVAAGDTAGQPGLAWRARRLAKDARRETHRAAVAARREAKLAKAQLT